MSNTLPYWIETMRTMPRQGSGEPGNLLAHAGAEYLFPLIPPGFEAHVLEGGSNALTTTQNRGLGTPQVPTAFAYIFFKINFGYLVPGAFRMQVKIGGVNAYDGTLTGTQLEDGINMLYFMKGDSAVDFYMTNMTNLNQRLEMTSQALLCANEEDYQDMVNQLHGIKFPYPVPEVPQ